MNIPQTIEIFDLVASDIAHERYSWNFIAIIKYHGKLEHDPENR